MDKHLPRRHHQRGQAAIWLLGTLAAGAAVMYAVFNTGQVIVGKERAVNAADAAALAGAQTEARLLNLMAYSNRCIVANEVLLAQLLSLESWTQYVGRTAGNIETVLNVLSLFPPLTAVAQTLSKVMGEAEQLAKNGRSALKEAVDGVIAGVELLKGGLPAAQGLIELMGGLMAGDAARSLLAANKTNFNGRWDPGLSLSSGAGVDGLTLVKNNADWMQFTQLYDASKRSDAKDILENSIDRFTRDRPGQGWLNMGSTLLGVGLEKHGGSRLHAFDRWESQDTLEEWIAPPLGVFCKGSCKTYIPIGWGRSTASRNKASGDVWDPSRNAQQLAVRSGESHGVWSGVPALYDIRDKSQAGRDLLGLNFVVAVSRNGGSDFTTTSLGMASEQPAAVAGSAHVPLKQRAGQQTVFAKARVFFERPRRSLAHDFTAAGLWRPDGAKEYGSLYSPYWQARLRDLTPGEKIALLGAMGLTPDYALYTPGGQ